MTPGKTAIAKSPSETATCGTVREIVAVASHLAIRLKGLYT